MGFEQIEAKLVSHWGGDRNAAESAWASSVDLEKLSQRSDQDVMRVVTNLVHLHHDTPKERLWLEFFITCPIYLERQFDKTRMSIQYQQFELTYMEAPMGRNNITQNELSGRYRTIPDRPYLVPNDVGDILNKARGFTANNIDDMLKQQHAKYNVILGDLKIAQKAGDITNQEYKRAREVIRGVLGTSYLTDMRIIMNMNAFEHIMNQRLALDAQMESRVLASKMLLEVRRANVVPTMLEEMIKANGWAGLIIW